jgi:indolepyruvate decarboxylase
MATSAPTPAAPPTTIGQYLIDRLTALGITHCFGIPGDYVLGLYKMLEESPIQLVGMTREDAAGFAADAYARIHGLGCVCVTYCVGGLSCANSIAGAYAEKSPVVVLSGSPGLNERDRNPLLHHKVRDFDTQLQVYRQFTVASAVLDDPLTAFHEIDRVLNAALRYKRPVYLEIPRDCLHLAQVGPHRPVEAIPPSDPAALEEALAEATAMLARAERPMILADVEIHRFGLQDDLLALAEATGLPIASTILGKSVVSETHPLFAGIYEAALGGQGVAELIEKSDCLLMLGCFLSDINTGAGPAQLHPSRCIDATSQDIRIRHHHYQDVRLEDFIRGLRDAGLSARQRPSLAHLRPLTNEGPTVPDAKMTSRRLFVRLNRLIEDHEMMVVVDVGDCLFGASELVISRRTEFIGPAYYTSMGFAVPASVGASMANPTQRPLVLVGDGAFQMTGMELSTVARNGQNPIVVVLNNKGYTTERFLLEGSFNDILNWAYHRLPEVLGSGLGFDVATEGQLDEALEQALARPDTFSILNVHLDPLDRSPALDRLAQRLGSVIRAGASREPSANGA